MTALGGLAASLADGRLRSRELVERCLARIADPKGEGSAAFISVYAGAARATADWVDTMRALGASLPLWAGIPVSVKDVFDVARSVTTCGSAVLADAPPAERDAAAVSRLRNAGFIPIGRTNMTEFAYSAIGMNARHGTPACVWDRASRRISGGSSSGAAISVVDAMAPVALGSDSGGSCRIPAALNGIVGFKPTARRVPLEGANCMAPSLDSIGSLAGSVECVAILDSVLAGEHCEPLRPRSLRSLRLAIPQVALEGLDTPIATAFAAAVTALARAGARIEEVPIPELDELPAINARGGFSAAEYYAWHRHLIAERADRYDPRILGLILRGRDQSAADYLDLMRLRRSLIDRLRIRAVEFDALAMPTVPIVAPRIEALADDAEYLRVNALLLRNTRGANFLDGCAISLPCHRPGEMPVGLMLQGPPGADRDILAIAVTIEQAFRAQRGEEVEASRP